MKVVANGRGRGIAAPLAPNVGEILTPSILLPATSACALAGFQLLACRPGSLAGTPTARRPSPSRGWRPPPGSPAPAI